MTPLEEAIVGEPDQNVADWLHPQQEEEGLRRYVETLRERWRLIAITVVVTTLISILYVLLAPKTYEGRADMLVTPVASDSGILRSLPLIFESVDPTRDVETASQFVTNLDVARSVVDELALDESPRELLKKVSAEPVAQSNIVAISATGDSPEQARDLANAFAEATVDDRTAQIHEVADQLIPGLEAQVTDATDEVARAEAAATLSQLQTVRSAPDPSLRVETLADLPPDQASPRPLLSIAGGILGGLVLGIVGAFGAQTLDSTLRRESQLRRLYGLPVLARIPEETGRRYRGPLGPRQISPVGAEAYRTLRSTVEHEQTSDQSKVVLVTGPSPSQGKSTTAVNLASSLALAGKEVILIEADLRRPALAQTLGLTAASGGVVDVLMDNARLEDALVTTERYGQGVRVLLADYTAGWIAELFSVPAARQMIEDARKLADYVIIDSPPLNLVSDAVPLARASDEVLIVVRIGQTRINRITELGELLAENGVRPAGFAVVGVPRPRRSESAYYLSTET